MKTLFLTAAFVVALVSSTAVISGPASACATWDLNCGGDGCSKYDLNCK